MHFTTNSVKDNDNVLILNVHYHKKYCNLNIASNMQIMEIGNAQYILNDSEMLYNVTELLRQSLIICREMTIEHFLIINLCP